MTNDSLVVITSEFELLLLMLPIITVISIIVVSTAVAVVVAVVCVHPLFLGSFCLVKSQETVGD